MLTKLRNALIANIPLVVGVAVVFAYLLDGGYSLAFVVSIIAVALVITLAFAKYLSNRTKTPTGEPC